MKSLGPGHLFRLVLLVMYFHTRPTLSFSIQMERKNDELGFNRNHTGVYFDPVDFMEYNGIPDGLDEYGLASLVNKVYSQFSQLMVGFHVPPKFGGNFKNDLVVETVAKLNVFLNGTSANCSFMNMAILVKVSDWKGTGVINSRLQQARKVIESANGIFPGTVTSVLLEMEEVTKESLQNYLEFRTFFKKFEGVNRTYKFGIKTGIKYCAGLAPSTSSSSDFSGILKDILSDDFLDIAYFSEYMNGYMEGVSVETKVEVFTGHFGHCQTLVLGLGKVNKLGFMTSWPDTGFGGGHADYVRLVDFWRRMDSWAGETQTDVIFLQAFDTSFDPERMMRTNGWWRLVPNGTYLHHSQFVFEEKLNLVGGLKVGNRTRSTREPKFASTPFGVLIVSVLVFVSLVFVIFYLPRKFKNKLSKVDIDEFIHGGDNSNLKLFGGPATTLNGPYKITNYELPRKFFTIDEAVLLGSGAFGKVCRGTVIKPGGGEEEEVAVKMTKVPCPRTALRGILFEIKILSYLGSHPHIVGLKGAYTAELKKRKAFVFLELCELGSLESYLRRRRSSLSRDSALEGSQSRRFSYLDSSNVGSRAELDESLVRDMHRWSREIASGMEFITANHIVHLDIATRNILLTADKRAKITDFGLSRRMYDYQTYVKKEQEPLPWRWMAPECLRRSEFTEKSDVWAFGVLLWEIYSLGDEPYPGLSYDFDFPTKLERGLRLSEPAFNRNGVYSVMLRCWATNPGKRPTFSELLHSLRRHSMEIGSAAEGDRFLPVPKAKHNWSTTQVCSDKCGDGNDLNLDEHDNNSKLKIIFEKVKKIIERVGYVWSSLAVALLLLIIAIMILSIRSHASHSSSNTEVYYFNESNIAAPSTSDITTNPFESATDTETGRPPVPPVTTEATVLVTGPPSNLDKQKVTEETTTEIGSESTSERNHHEHTTQHGQGTMIVVDPVNITDLDEERVTKPNAIIRETGDLPPIDIDLQFRPQTSTKITLEENDESSTPLPITTSNIEERYGTLLGQKLFAVIDRQDDESVIFLVYNGANLNERNGKGETPLHRAALCKDKTISLKIIKYLITNGADANAEDLEGYTFLHRLVDDGTTLTPNQLHDLANYLVSNNASQVFNSEGRSASDIKRLITPFLMTVKNLAIQTPTLTLLQKHGVNFNALGSDLDSVLYYAMVGNRSMEVITKLVELGADWRHANKFNQSLLHRAAQFGNVEGLKFFLKLGLDVNGKDQWGYTPLDRVVNFSRENVFEMVRVLIEHGARVKIKDSLGLEDSTKL